MNIQILQFYNCNKAEIDSRDLGTKFFSCRNFEQKYTHYKIIASL